MQKPSEVVLLFAAALLLAGALLLGTPGCERRRDERSEWNVGHGGREVRIPDAAKIDEAIDRIEKTKTFADQLKDIETRLAASPSLEMIAKVFAKVRDIEFAAQALELGGSYRAQYVADVELVTSKYVEVLRARATAAAGATTREGLAPYAELEDTLRFICQAAMEANDVEAMNQFHPIYRQCATEINDIVERLFDDAAVAKVAPQDLLADKNAWTVVSSPTFVPMLAWPMTLRNAEGGQSGGVLYTPGDQWRDYVLEIDVTLRKGTLTVLTRVGDENKLGTEFAPGVTFGTENTTLSADYGRTQTLTVKVVGSTIMVFVDGSPLYRDRIALRYSRRGKPCLEVAGGTDATISKMNVRVLR